MSASFLLSDRALGDDSLAARESSAFIASSSPTEAATVVARELVDKNVVTALVRIRNEGHRSAVRDALLQLLLRQMTNQAPASAAVAARSNANNAGSNRGATGSAASAAAAADVDEFSPFGGGGVFGDASSGSSAFGGRYSSSSSSPNGGGGAGGKCGAAVAPMDVHLPAGVEHMATLIALNAVSQRGSAVTILKLLASVQTRRAALALLAKVAEGCVREYRRTRRLPERVGFYDTDELRDAVFAIYDASTSPAEPQPHGVVPAPPASYIYQCKFIAQCFGWSSPSSSLAGGGAEDDALIMAAAAAAAAAHDPHETLAPRRRGLLAPLAAAAAEAPRLSSVFSTLVTPCASLTLVRRPHRVPCYSIVAVPQHAGGLSLVATCGRDVGTIDVFRDVGVNNDYALSSFSVPPAFAPLSLVGASARGDAMIALCCGVEVSEKVGIGVVRVHDAAASARCEVREVYGISSPTCAVPVSVAAPNICGPVVAVGCCVPGGYGITTVAVETTQRPHTIANAHGDTVTCMETLFGGSVVAAAWRDGAVDLWDIRRHPRGPCMTLFHSGVGNDVTTAIRLVNTNMSSGGGGGGAAASGGGASHVPLLMTGGFDGLLRVWDLRAIDSGGSNGGHPVSPLLDGCVAATRLDGPVLSIASMPSERCGADIAVATTRSLSLLHLGPRGLGLNQVVPNRSATVLLRKPANTRSNQLRGASAAGGGGSDGSPTGGGGGGPGAGIKGDGGMRSEANLDLMDVLADAQLHSPLQDASTTRTVSNVYHNLCFVDGYAGTDDTYLLAGSEVGDIEAFRFHCSD